MAVIVIFPFYWMIISSFKTMDEYRANVPTLWPQNIVFENFATAFSKAKITFLPQRRPKKGYTNQSQLKNDFFY